MSRPIHIPASFLNRTFTTAEWVAAGHSRKTLAAKQFTRLGRGVYTTSTIGDITPDQVTALVRTIRGGVVSHVTAALFYGLPLPRRLRREAAQRVHVTVHRTRRAWSSEQPLVASHRLLLPEDHIHLVRGVQVTTPARTWRDLASQFLPHEYADFVAAGDYLVQPPYRSGTREEPWCSVADLHSVVGQGPRFVGGPLARHALEDVRVGADSAMETLTRLTLVGAGLPEPLLQYRADEHDPECLPADMAYPQWRIVIEYDGGTHRSPEQYERDAARDRWYAERGWLVLRVNKKDASSEFRELIAAVRRRAAAVG
ncbi:MAG: DUF559 domain-containing protein [Micrococcus sp.]|nr:DUF559 domain-containing protein [Micrococcus sp.]